MKQFESGFVCLVCMIFVCGCGQFGPFHNRQAPMKLGGDQLRASVPWLESWDLAASQAHSENKIILACFTGSDWCAWCQKLEREVFETAEFDSWAQRNAVLLKLDFPRKEQPEILKQNNEQLALRYADHVGEGYPTVLILTPDGQVLGKLGYVAGGPSAWLRKASQFLAPVTIEDGEAE